MRADLMRVLVIGASGFIGHYLERHLLQNSGFDVTSTYNSRPPKAIDQSWSLLEITDRHRLDQIFLEVRPEVVVLLAAIADVKTAERGPERATEVNVDGARQVARLCTQHDARLIFLSSEYVFRGDRGNYQEDDLPDPNTHYGRTKWEAELAVADEASQWSIVRTSLVYGWPITGRQNLATVIVDRLKNGESYEGDTGTYRTPIYVEHLTEGIMQLVTNYHPGIFHLAGTDWMNMYQFGRAVAGVFDLDSRLVNSVQISGDLTSENATSAALEQRVRPDILGLNCTQTNQMLGLRSFSVVTGLQQMLV
jgi:dTDP-4-dehydrorhamnose reductase